MQTKSSTSDSGVNGQYLESSHSPATVDKAASGVSREFHSFLSDIEDLIKATTSLTGEDLAAAKAKLSERIAAARDSVAEISGTITQRVRKSATVTNNYVHDNPWQAIGVGAAVGVLVGYLLGRRSA
jgi:ElaB/YqjD/DUF883 family membrane-anchored ribosome-binding protein